MRILLNNIYYYPNLAGGAEISVLKLAEGLALNKSNDVFVLTSSDTNEHIEERINNVTVFRLPLSGDKGSRLQRRVNRVFDFTDYRIIFDTIRKIQPDVVHTNNLRTFSVAIWKAANKLGIPIVHTLRDYVMIDIYRYNIEKIIIKHYSNLVSAITAPSNFTLNLHLEKGLFSRAKNKIAIYNAIDFDIAEIMSLYQRKNQQNMNRNRPFRLAYIGRFSEEKGVNWLIQVFAKNMSNKELHLFGSGTLKPETRDIIEKTTSIIEHGKLTEEQLNKSLEDIDIVVVPSLWEEPFGRVILDAYKNCIPVIVTNRGGMPEIVSNHITGLIIEPRDEELIEAINLMCDVETLSYMRKRILKVISKFSLETQVNQYMALYQSVIVTETN